MGAKNKAGKAVKLAGSPGWCFIWGDVFREGGARWYTRKDAFQAKRVLVGRMLAGVYSLLVGAHTTTTLREKA